MARVDSSGARKLADLDISLLGRGHRRLIDDLAAHRQMAPFFQLAIKIGIQRVERAGGGEPLTEHADRVRVGCRRAKVEDRETKSEEGGVGKEGGRRVRIW